MSMVNSHQQRRSPSALDRAFFILRRAPEDACLRIRSVKAATSMAVARSFRTPHPSWHKGCLSP
jgi:hypothetical protein